MASLCHKYTCDPSHENGPWLEILDKVNKMGTKQRQADTVQ